MLAELAPLVGAGLGVYGAHRANQQAKQLAREQMNFQERMSNTSYQRAMNDMQQAGLNPVIAFGGGAGGASTPGGAMAPIQNEAAGAVNSALEVRRANAELKNLEEQNDVLRSQKILNITSAKRSEEEARKVGHEIAQSWIRTGTDAASDVLALPWKAGKKSATDLFKSLGNWWRGAKK